MDSDSETAVLIYYSNVTGSTPNNTLKYAYNTNIYGINYMGPLNAKTQLPKKSEWINVSLKNEVRAIKNQAGGTTTKGGDLPTSFDYSEYAARLITSQEVQKGCGKSTVFSGGNLENCNYLVENTQYANLDLVRGYWLETPRNLSSSSVYFADGCYLQLDVGQAYSELGIRPVIEVSKSKIEM